MSSLGFHVERETRQWHGLGNQENFTCLESLNDINKNTKQNKQPQQQHKCKFV